MPKFRARPGRWRNRLTRREVPASSRYPPLPDPPLTASPFASDLIGGIIARGKYDVEASSWRSSTQNGEVHLFSRIGGQVPIVFASHTVAQYERAAPRLVQAAERCRQCFGQRRLVAAGEQPPAGRIAADHLAVGWNVASHQRGPGRSRLGQGQRQGPEG